MKNKIIFDCPHCSVFMKKYRGDKKNPISFICPICKSIFLPSQKALNEVMGQGIPVQLR